MDKTCCVTGHRDIPISQASHITKCLEDEIVKAVSNGYMTFISGFADGVDLCFAEIVANIKKINKSILLKAAIPYRNRIYSDNQKLQALLAECEEVMIICENYQKSCFILRNKFMVDNSNLVIAVHDGRATGGTAFTIDYANKMKKEIVLIDVDNIENKT